jgi:hypothetical protein
VAAANNVTVKGRDELSSLNKRLADAGVYNRLVQRKVHVWTGVRNHADHGEFEQYSTADVADMLRGVGDFLPTYLS